MRLIQDSVLLQKPLVWLEINTKVITENLKKLRALISNKKIMAVLKANAYGLGAPGVAATLADAVDLFGVVGLKEALGLRAIGITKPIVNLGAYCNEDAPTLIKNSIAPTIFTPDALKNFSAAAAALKKTAPVWLKIDTGLNRLGVPASEALPLIRSAWEEKNIALAGIYSTLSEDPILDKKQLTQFLQIKKECNEKNIKIPLWSLGTSEAVFLFPNALLDVVRLGISLLGYYPSSGAAQTQKINLKPCATYKTRVLCVKEINPGEGVFYRQKFIAQQKTRIAVLLAGYSYGLNPLSVNGRSVLIGGQLFPLVGGIGTTNCFVDVGTNDTIKTNDEVVIFGEQGGAEISLSKINEITKENSYEILSRIPEKVERVYL